MGLQQITSYGKNGVVEPSVAPNGLTAAYSTDEGSFVIRLDKSWSEQTPDKLPLIDSGHRFRPYAWSPDGKRLAGRVDPSSAFGEMALYSLDTKPYQLFKASPSDNSHFFWLQGGHIVAFNVGSQMYAVNIQSGAVQELPPAPAGATASPGSVDVYFSVADVSADIWLISK